MLARFRPWIIALLVIWLLTIPPGPLALADEVLFVNGDRLSGKLVSAAEGTLILATEGAGTVTIDLAKVKTLRTDGPVVLRVGDQTPVTSKVSAGVDGAVEVTPAPGAPPRVVALRDVTQINPPPVRWAGSLQASAVVTQGNSETENAGARFDATRRSEQHRFILGGGYYYGRQVLREGGGRQTTTDNGFLLGKYDYFFAEKRYAFAALRLDRDRIADLDLRVTPSAGLGYQWFEGPTFNLSTEAGLAWVYERQRHAGSNDHVAGRVAYHVDWRPHQVVLLYHETEWLPSLDRPSEDYNLNMDAGVRVNISDHLFTDLRVDLRYDATPAPGREPEDLSYLVSVGWAF